MPKPSSAWRSVSPHEHPRRLAGSLLAPAGLTLALGIACLWGHLADGQPRPLRASTGVLLLLAGVVQARLGMALWSHPRNSLRLWSRPALWQWLLIGLAVSYALAAMLGTAGGAPYALLAGVLWWYTLTVLVLTAEPATAERPWKVRRLTVRTRRAAAAAVAATLLAEAGLQLWHRLPDGGGRLAIDQLTAASALGGPGQAARAGRLAGDARALHVAAIGDAATLDPGLDGRLAQSLQAAVPGVNWSIHAEPHAGPREFAGRLLGQATAADPDLVLIFVAVGDDLLGQQRSADPFDWGSWRLADLARHYWPGGWVPHARSAAEDFWAGLAQRMSLCRAPMPAVVRAQWRESLVELDRAAWECGRRGLPLGLVVVPADVQVSTALRTAAARRAGLADSELDLELPQRRLAAFAAERKLNWIDLLPVLRASSQPAHLREAPGLSPAGSALAAQAVGDWLGRRAAQFPLASQVTTAP